jgi:hypothetical protein
VFSSYYGLSLLSKEVEEKRRMKTEKTTPKKKHLFTDKLQMLGDRCNTLPNISPPQNLLQYTLLTVPIF